MTAAEKRIEQVIKSDLPSVEENFGKWRRPEAGDFKYCVYEGWEVLLEGWRRKLLEDLSLWTAPERSLHWWRI